MKEKRGLLKQLRRKKVHIKENVKKELEEIVGVEAHAVTSQTDAEVIISKLEQYVLDSNKFV